MDLTLWCFRNSSYHVLQSDRVCECIVVAMRVSKHYIFALSPAAFKRLAANTFSHRAHRKCVHELSIFNESIYNTQTMQYGP